MEQREKNVVVKNNGFARNLYKMGHELLDFKSDFMDRKKTIFYFKEDGTTQSDLDDMINAIVR